MNNIAISVKDVSKKYRLYDSPKHRMKEALNIFGKKYHHDFWALRDISFDLHKGETFGILGRNGCGKSTLLQIICGILLQSSGEVVTNGRISALLELGTGFNPEYTGRSNVYMNGAIMGFSRKNIDKQIESIEEFADIGEYRLGYG
jgi:ABC-type polysaccharide/polyol phosphate transport system ATPase subunit